MDQATKAYLRDKDNNNLLVASDWSIIQNKPKNIATTDQLPKLGPWQRDGIEYKNGAYDWDHVNNGYNCAYRVADMGSFKIVEVRLAFGVNQDIVNDTEVIDLPKVIKPDGNEELFSATGIRGVFIHTTPDNNVHVYCQHFSDNDGSKYTKDGLLTYHTTYFTTL